MADTAKLYELQKTDLNWEKVKRRLLQIQKLMGEPDDIRLARQKVSDTEADLHKWQAEQKNAELESQSLLEKVSASEQRLMGGQVRNPKELDALQHSIDAMKRQRITVDDHGVEAMIKAEEVRVDLDKQQQALAQLEAKLGEKHGELAEEETKLKRTFLQLKTHRAKLNSVIPPAEIEQYEEMRRRKGGIAVASIENGQCSACNTKVPTGATSNARNLTQITYCPSCARILVSM